MPHNHRLAYAALAAVYLVLAIILVRDGTLPHAGCVLTAAAIYAALSQSASHPVSWAARLQARIIAALARVRSFVNR